MEILGKGLVQFCSKDKLIVSRGFKLYIHNNNKWRLWCVLPVSFFQKFLSNNRWFSRLTRNEIFNLININENTFACFAFGSIYLIKNKTNSAQLIGRIKGSRPLCTCTDGEHIYYGVYKRNTKRKPINIWSYSLKNKEWNIFYSFENIRHIHGVFWDKFESRLWVTTGDLDHESTIWKFDKNGVPHKVATGSQQTRTVQLVFLKHSIFYASDSPQELNYIYLIDRQSTDIQKLQKVGGPVFYGFSVGNWVFFATVVEPSKVNRTDVAELWGSDNEGRDWILIKEYKKDFLPKKLFQYGQIKFPSGTGDDMNLYFSPYATELDQMVIGINLNQISNLTST